jgi:RNA polymerase sigma factor (sigma-70 family)
LGGLAGGDDSAWRRFDELYGHWLRAKIWRQLQAQGVSGYELDDVAQQVRIKMLRYLGTFQRRRKGSFRMWLSDAIHDTVRDIAKKGGKNRPTVENLGSQAGLIGEDAEGSSEHLPEDVQLLRMAMETARNQVRAVEWTAFEQYKLLGRSPTEVARELEIARTLVHRYSAKVIAIIRMLLMDFDAPPSRGTRP